MSQIVAFCPSCQKKYKIDTSLLGRVLKCKACETLFEIAKPPETVVPTTPARPAPAPASDPLAADPLAIDPLAVDPLAIDPLGVDPLAVDPLAVDPLAIDPLAVDPLAVDPLAVDPLAVDPLAIDPLAPGPQSRAAAAPIPAAAPVPAAAAGGAGWQKAVSEHKKQQRLGGNERALLLLGGFLLVFGLVMNLLPLFGMQVARMQGTGKMGQIVGLLMGLAGAGMLAGGLRNFRLAAIISGAAGGGFLLVVFLVSLLAGREPDVDPLLVDVGPGGGDRFAYDINNVSSPWRPTYGDWEGFSSQLRRGSATAQWQRVSSGVDGVSASFFGALQASRDKISIEGQDVSSEIVQSRSGQQVFELVTFEYPDSDAENGAMLDAVESTIRNLSDSKPVTIESFPAREYTARGASRGRHGVIVVAGSTVIMARISGPPAHVPGENSRKFIASLQIEPGVATGSVSTADYEGDLLDPFTFDGSVGDAAPSRPPGATTTATNVQLSSADRQHDQKIQDHMRALQGAMEEHINLRVQINFNSRYLSVSAGEDTRNPRYFAHPGKVPVTGIDFVVTRSGDSHAFTNLTPVYDTATTDCVVQARPGYGLSGLRVNARDHVEGIKFVFSKVTDRGFDESRSYESDWYGTPASGSGQVVDSGGSPVYGLWMCKRNIISSLGLIREK